MCLLFFKIDKRSLVWHCPNTPLTMAHGQAFLIITRQPPSREHFHYPSPREGLHSSVSLDSNDCLEHRECITSCMIWSTTCSYSSSFEIVWNWLLGASCNVPFSDLVKYILFSDGNRNFCAHKQILVSSIPFNIYCL